MHSQAYGNGETPASSHRRVLYPAAQRMLIRAASAAGNKVSLGYRCHQQTAGWAGLPNNCLWPLLCSLLYFGLFKSLSAELSFAPLTASHQWSGQYTTHREHVLALELEHPWMCFSWRTYPFLGDSVVVHHRLLLIPHFTECVPPETWGGAHC